MNKTQEKAIEAHKLRLQAIAGELETIKSELETLRDEAQEAFDNKSERWQEGDKGEEAQAQIERLTSAYDAAESGEQSASEAADAIEEWQNNA